MVCVVPDSKVPHQTPILLLSVIPDTPHDGSVICKLLNVTQLRVVAEVRGVQSEEKRGQYRPLGGSCAANYSVRCDFLQPDILWPVNEIAGDPGNQAGVHSYPGQFFLLHKGL